VPTEAHWGLQAHEDAVPCHEVIDRDDVRGRLRVRDRGSRSSVWQVEVLARAGVRREVLVVPRPLHEVDVEVRAGGGDRGAGGEVQDVRPIRSVCGPLNAELDPPRTVDEEIDPVLDTSVRPIGLRIVPLMSRSGEEVGASFVIATSVGST
jgi:hypothetical protein